MKPIDFHLDDLPHAATDIGVECGKLLVHNFLIIIMHVHGLWYDDAPKFYCRYS